MPRDAIDIDKSLCQKGFKRRQGDHAFYHLYVEGKKTCVFTKISHGKKEVPDGLLSAMARQARLPRKKFLELVDCPLSEAQYLDLLRAQQVIK